MIAAGQVPGVEGLRHSLAELGAARDCFEAAIVNVGILTSMLDGPEALFED